MKSTRLGSLLGFAVLVSACSRGDVQAAPPAITPLSIEQVERLLPYMVQMRKHGDRVRRTTRSEIAPGQVFVQHATSQAYTFSVWVDEDGRPVTPDAKGEPAAAARRPVRQNGTIEVICIGGCVPNTSGGEPCTINGCEPVDNSCGCTPIDCPGCESAGCLPGGSGALAGVLVLQ